MWADQARAHGVTPGLRRDYRLRTAGHQVAFALEHLRPGMSLLDVGCGPGTITVGLAELVDPGRVVGIDHDPVHIRQANELARERGLTNVHFLTGDARSLPIKDAAFDAAFESDMLTHMADEAPPAAAEILWRAGFVDLVKGISADNKGDRERIQSHAELTVDLLDGPFGQAIVEHRWGDRAMIDRLKDVIRDLAEPPDAFFANVHVEVLGWKSGQP